MKIKKKYIGYAFVALSYLLFGTVTAACVAGTYLWGWPEIAGVLSSSIFGVATFGLFLFIALELFDNPEKILYDTETKSSEVL